MDMPSAIIFINNDMNDAVRTTITSQLEINETISFSEFNARITADPNYPIFVHGNKLRVLVLLPTFRDYTNRDLADIVIFLKQGLASVEKNKFGPPGLTLEIQRLNIWNLINGLKGFNSSCYPFPPNISPLENQTPENPKPHEHLGPHHITGLGALELLGVEALEAGSPGQSAFGGPIEGTLCNKCNCNCNNSCY